MSRWRVIGRRAFCSWMVLATSAPLAQAQDDPGRSVVGRVTVEVYHAIHGEPARITPDSASLDEATLRRLRAEERLRFDHYRLLGSETQAIFRSYENWAQPLKPSDEVLVRFEARSRPTAESARLDLEMWFSRRKVLKTDARLERERPLFVLGPEWRGGRLIISVRLAPEANSNE